MNNYKINATITFGDHPPPVPFPYRLGEHAHAMWEIDKKIARILRPPPPVLNIYPGGLTWIDA